MKHASALLLASYCGLSHAFASSTVHMQDNIWPFQACDLLPPPKISAFIDVCVKRARESQASERERETRERPERERERRERERARKSRTRYLFWLRPFQSFGICCTFDPQATLINHGHFPSKFERAGADIGRKLQTVCHQCRQGRSSQIRGRARLDRQLGRLRCSGVSARRGTLWMKIPLSGALDNLGPPGSPAQAV